LIVNRSVPAAVVIPVLAYEDVAEASRWLCEVFGFRQRLRIGDHRVQLVYSEGAVILTARAEPASNESMATHSVHVRIEDADRHHARAVAGGAQILHPPTDYPYGERQYGAEDPGGHRWTFSQSIADVDPVSWGATSVDL
jgi:uncharacterized glyoxalase superfamily protein PhnB